MTSEVNGRAGLIVCQEMELAMFDFDLGTLRLTNSTSKFLPRAANQFPIDDWRLGYGA